MTSLGNLYFGTANDKVSRRLFDVWMMHEISNVRNHCAAAINAIGNTVYVELMRTVTDVPNLSTIAAVAGYVDMHEGPGGREARLLQSTDILELTTSMSSPDWCVFTAHIPLERRIVTHFFCKQILQGHSVYRAGSCLRPLRNC